MSVSRLMQMGAAGYLVVWTDPDLANASYDSVSFSVTAEASDPHGIFFKPDGTKMYVTDDGNNALYQYSLSTAWDVSTASYDSVSFSVVTQESIPTQVYFKPDGTKFYLTGFASDTVFEYSLSTAWDLSTASYNSVSFDASGTTTTPNALSFKPDGTKFFLGDFITDLIYQFSLSTAWDLSTASYDSVSFSVASQEGTVSDIHFNPDGDKMYIIGPNADSVFQYSLSTAWDLSTASYDSISFSATSQEGNARGMAFKNDGSKLYVTGYNNNTIYQYST